MSSQSHITPSQLVLSAVFFLQKKNGVSASDITKYICEKRGCKEEEIQEQVKKALEKATKKGIFTKKKGLYRIKKGLEKNKISEKTETLKKEPFFKELNSGKMPFKNKIMNGATSEVDNWRAGADFVSKENLGSCMSNTKTGDEMGDRSVRNISIQKFQSLKGNDDDEDDEDFLEEDEDDDDDVDFFSDDQLPRNVEKYQEHKSPSPEPEKCKPDYKKTISCRNKSKSKTRKRKTSKPRKKYSKRRKTTRSEYKKQIEESSGEGDDECDIYDKDPDENRGRTKVHVHEHDHDSSGKCKPKEGKKEKHKEAKTNDEIDEENEIDDDYGYNTDGDEIGNDEDRKKKTNFSKEEVQKNREPAAPEKKEGAQLKTEGFQNVLNNKVSKADTSAKSNAKNNSECGNSTPANQGDATKDETSQNKNKRSSSLFGIIKKKKQRKTKTRT